MVVILRMDIQKKVRWDPDFSGLPLKLIQVGFTVGLKTLKVIFLKLVCLSSVLMNTIYRVSRPTYSMLLKKNIN